MPMLKGFVSNFGEPVVQIELVFSTSDKSFKHLAVIDTGFIGYLSVPEKLAQRYEWQWIGMESYEIASGSTVDQKVFLGKINWFGDKQDIYVLTSQAKDLLIGTRLLENYKLAIDFKSKKVQINKSL